jgi:phenylacetate-CoA ligase
MLKSIYFIKYCLMKPDSFRRYLDVTKAQFYPVDQLQELSWLRTRALVRHVYEHVPFYRARFDGIGLSPDDVRTIDDFQKIPLLTRQDVRANRDSLVAEGIKPGMLNTVTTGGSTGVPLTVFHPRKVSRAALLWRMLSWWGLSPGASIATMYRSSGDTKVRLKNKLIRWPAPLIQLNASSYTSQDIEVFLDQVNRMKPDVIHGYVGAVDDVAAYILDRGIKVASPRAVWVTSAPLSAVQEARIQRAFGAPVCDQYGSCEVYYMAAECPAKEGLHLFEDVQRMEFLGEDGLPVPDGERGNIAVTDLDNYAFPLIRYLNGDVGRRLTKPCSCGRSLSLMDKVGGRISDVLVLPSGRKINGEYLTTIFDDHPEVVQRFQVYQSPTGAIEIRVECPVCSEINLSILESVRARIADNTGREVPVTVKIVERIQADRGKLRFVVSDFIKK